MSMNQDPSIRSRRTAKFATRTALAALALAGCGSTAKQVASAPRPIGPSVVTTVVAPRVITEGQIGGALPGGNREQVQYMSDGTRQIAFVNPDGSTYGAVIYEGCDATQPAPNPNSVDIESDQPGDTLYVTNDFTHEGYYVFKARVCMNAAHVLTAAEFASDPGALE